MALGRSLVNAYESSWAKLVGNGPGYCQSLALLQHVTSGMFAVSVTALARHMAARGECCNPLGKTFLQTMRDAAMASCPGLLIPEELILEVPRTPGPGDTPVRRAMTPSASPKPLPRSH